MALLNEELRIQLKGVLDQMENPVTLALFTAQADCDTCEETKSFMAELEDVGEKVVLELYDIQNDKEKADLYNVSLTPSIVLLDHEGKDNGIKFNGIPAGHEINSLITDLLEVSGAGEDFPEEVKASLANLQTPINMKVFVTLGCPHCPGAVAKAHKLALESPHITAEMIEAQTFSDLSNEYNVSSVPKIVFNDDHEMVGNQPIEQFLEMIEHLQGHHHH